MALNGLPCENGIGRATVNTVGVIGLGMIGCSWTALIIAQGVDVIGYDPSADAEERVAAEIRAQEPALRALGLTTENPGRFTLGASIEEVASVADVIQENGPERLDTKRALMARISAVAPADVVIASSTSGLTPSEFSVDAQVPERVLVGHPFLPVTIMPLVEIVGGKRTAPAALEWLSHYYKALGKKTVTLKREVPGFLGNRFQVLVLEEALSLIECGVATVEDIEAVFADGIGLRWSLLGPVSLMTLAAGDAGLRETWGRYADYHQHVRSSVDRVRDADAAIELAEKQSKELNVARNPAEIAAKRDELLLDMIKLRKNRSII